MNKSYVCPYCNSEDIVRNAEVRYDPNIVTCVEWRIETLLDTGFCLKCEIRIDGLSAADSGSVHD